MSPRDPRPPEHRSPADSTEAVDAFMQALDHPFKGEIEVLRRVILGAHPSIAEGIKWNAPSFRTTEYFATVHLRARDGLGIILHLGARARALPAAGIEVADPGGLLQWLAPDRAMVHFKGFHDIEAKTAALVSVLQQWVACV